MNRISRRYCVVMWILAISVAFAYGISIDGQISVVKNDCYERMTIGEKLSPKQTYKTFYHNTVAKCEMECTQEKDQCRAFSFGIGPKGNGTCLLSRNPVKETADLKPIGTISDTDYDLYIKKLDCQVVLQQPHFQGSHTPPERPPNLENKPFPNGEDHHYQNGYIDQGHHNGQEENYDTYGNVQSHSNHQNYVSKPDNGPEDGYHYNKPANQYLPSTPNPQGGNMHHVETLVSIASGPQSILHPLHDILVAADLYRPQKFPKPGENGYGDNNDDMPPFRPPALNHPYDTHRPQEPDQRPFPEGYDKPDPQYENLKPKPETGYYYEGQEKFNNNRPISAHPNDFGRPYGQDRPLYGSRPNEDRPDPEYGLRPPKVSASSYGSGGQFTIDRRKYESSNQFNSYESETYRYGSEYPKLAPNYNFYDHYGKPNPNHPSRYGSVIPHPNDYNRPDPHYDYLFIRPSEPYEDRRPSPRPVRPGYNEPERPLNRPDFNDAAGSRPDYGGNQRPVNAGIGYKFDIPSRPDFDNPNERPLNSYQQSNCSKPTRRPVDSSTLISRPPSTELSNHYGGVDYGNKQHEKHIECLNVKDDGGNRKIITQNIGYHGEHITSIITELKNNL